MALFSSRNWLRWKAVIWRNLMKIGMAVHKLAPPRPAPPSFEIVIPSRISSSPGSFKLVFYVPHDYKSAGPNQRFPVVVNFHGGGFTIGTATDDARWAKSVVENAKAVLVSVEYRLAPEFPFSIAVEDGTDAILYLAAHAEELRLDPHRIALSGFSAGGNLTLTVPLMLHDLQTSSGKRSIKSSPNSHDAQQLEITQQIPPLTIVSLISFYPPTDYRISRSVKNATNPRPELNLSATLINLFNTSYMSVGHTTVPLDLADPYLSPAAASDALLQAAYPQSIVLITCEYDSLNAEAVEFGERLRGKGIEKTVSGRVVPGVKHAFDKMPSLWQRPAEAEKCYVEACAELSVVFGRGGALAEGGQ